MTAGRADFFAKLDALGIVTRTREHDALFSVEDARALRGEIPGAHSKNLFLKSKKGSLWLVIALETTEIDLNGLAKAMGCGRFSFARAELMVETLGVEPGSVTPFALINDRTRRVNVVLDAALMAHEELNFHPLENTATTTIARDGLLAFIAACGHQPEILDLTAHQDRVTP
jgi:Ala-tRNA(Pro) deacylase